MCRHISIYIYIKWGSLFSSKISADCALSLKSMKLSTWLEYHNINIFSPGAIENCTPYGGHLGFQNGRHCRPALLNISLTSTDIETVETPIPIF